MGTHPIFESDFDCLTDWHIGYSLGTTENDRFQTNWSQTDSKTNFWRVSRRHTTEGGFDISSAIYWPNMCYKQRKSNFWKSTKFFNSSSKWETDFINQMEFGSNNLSFLGVRQGNN